MPAGPLRAAAASQIRGVRVNTAMEMSSRRMTLLPRIVPMLCFISILFRCARYPDLEQADNEDAQRQRPANCRRITEIARHETRLIQIHHDGQARFIGSSGVVQHDVRQLEKLERADGEG